MSRDKKRDDQLQAIIQRHVDALVRECAPRNADEFRDVAATVARACLEQLVELEGFPKTMLVIADIAASIAPGGHKVELATVERGPHKFDA